MAFKFVLLFYFPPFIIWLATQYEWAIIPAAITAVFAFGYVIYDLKKIAPLLSFFKPVKLKKLRKANLIILGLFVPSALLFTVFVVPENLFIVVYKAPLMWISICFIYIFLSTLPQELIYRVYLEQRFCFFENNNRAQALLNAITFSFAHIMFNNALVLLLTFVGGLLFFNTYNQTRSLWTVVAEHSIYGLWLFTLGLGAMLAFPMPG